MIAGPMNLKAILLNEGYHQFDWLGQVRHLEGLPLEIIQACLINLGIVLALRELGRVRIAWPLMTTVTIYYTALGVTYLWIFHQPMFT
jgi:hypothetical protein